MKKLLLLICMMFICVVAPANTIEWYVDGSLYQTTTCASGDNITPPTAPEKYGYSFMGWGRYTRLEYIESTGTQYIDTGVNFLFGDEFYFDYLKVSNILNLTVDDEQNGYGAGANINIIITGGGRISQGKMSIFAGRDGYYAPEISSNNIMQKHYVENWRISTGKIESRLTDVDSSDIYSLTIYNQNLKSSYNSGNSLFLFRDHLDKYAAPSATRLYTTWLKRINGDYVFNLIPAKRISDNAIGMYDTVTDTFFENAGTGTFVAGPEVGVL